MDIKTVLVSILTSGIVTALFQAYVKQGINNHYSKKLASFNESLTIKAESRKLDFDRMIHDFSIYSTKRHEVYPKLFEKIYQSGYRVKFIKENSYLSHTFIKDKDTLEVYLRNKPFFQLEEEDINKIITAFQRHEDDTNNACLEASKLLKNILIGHLHSSSWAAYEYYSANMLYFSKDVSILVEETIAKLQFLLLNETEFFEESDREVLNNGIEFDRVLDKLKEKLQSELSIGDYKSENT
jgi:hypothetical protein